MNLDPLTFAFSQISNLVTNVSKKNYKQVTQELANIVNTYGLEADRYLLRCLFSLVDFSPDGNRNPSTGNKDGLLTQLLIQECNNLLYKPALVSLLCYAFDHPLHQQKTLKPGPNLFPQIRKLLKLTPVQEVVFGLALEHSDNPDTQKLAVSLVAQKLPDLVASYTDADNTRQHEGGLHDTTPEVLHLILTHLSPETAPVLWKRLQRDFPREVVPVVLCPLLYPNSPDPNTMEQPDGLGAGLLEAGLPSLVPDLGIAFTASVDSCKTMLTTFTGGELSAATVAHTITAMLLSPPADPRAFFDKPDKPSPDQQWNMELFIMVVKELHPNMAWRDVVAELDNPKFLIKDRNAFHLLFSGLRHCFEQFQFPIELFYRRWNNSDGQYSLILQVLKNPETFCFADYPFHPVPTETLKASPDSENKEIATWRSQDLIEILLVLGEHPRLCTQIIELFKFPMQHCPDVLMLGLLQNQAPLNALRQELMTNMVPTFLGMHPNGSVILHSAWNNPAHTVNARSIIMSCMSEWYLRSDNDQARLSRILDIAQELKALTLILASQVMPFVIDLACLASRRGYLKLDKWLSDRIREHGESFISACVTFLQRRCPQIASGKEDIPPKAGQLPHDTVTTILGCLQVCANNVSKDLAEAIMQMIANCNLLANKARQPAGVLRHRGLDPFTPFSGSQPIDPLSGLSSTLQGMSLGAGISGLSTMASMSSGLGSLVSTPASPSRIVPTSQSPFPVYVNQNQALQHAAGTSQVGSLLPRVPAAPGIDKPQVNQINQIFGEEIKVLPKEVEDEANSYFQQIYNHSPHASLSIEEVLEKLKKFMESSKQHERDVFNCMLKNLFEEYQFFPQYPDKELLITAQLLGGIIEHGLVNNYMALGIALRYVLDALRKSPGTKMYYFGITALDRFKSRLREFTKYCQHVAGIHHFREFPPHLIAYIEYGLQSESPPSNINEGSLLPPHLAALLHQPKAVANPAKAVGTGLATKGPLSIANATNIDTLLVATEKEDKMVAPPDVIQDKIGFIFNNLSQLNLNTKCDELRDLLTKDYWPWVSQYLVLKRVTIEVNFHVLYANFLDALKLPELSRMVLMETHRNIKVLLRSDKGIANFSDRSLLKNLGHWLGMLSLAKNKPILMIDIDVKSLIIEAWTKGQQELLYVIPFVAKIMESCAKSRVFRPTNPWTMAVLNLLAELHQDPLLKLNLKFEIEVLCKALDTEVAKLTPSNLLKDTKRLEGIEAQMNKLDNKATTPLSHAMSSTNTTPVKPVALPRTEELPPPLQASAIGPMSVIGGTPGGGTPQPSVTPSIPTPVEPRFHVSDLNAQNFTGLLHLLTVPSLKIIEDMPQLKACIRTSVDRAVHEWDSPVTERSIKIAASTTEAIIRRDFALEPDEVRMRNAAHTLMRNLTGSMAMITCRDHMLQSISTNLKNAFTAQMRGASKEQLERAEIAATKIAEDNMELACAYIQKLAMEKSCTEIDKKLNDAYEVRKLARNEGRRYFDTALLSYQLERMPEQIRHSVGGVNVGQYNSVYGECGKTVPGFLPLTERDVAALGPKELVTPAAPFPTGGPVVQYPEDDTTVLYDKLIEVLDMHLQAALNTGNSPRIVALAGLRDTALLARRLRDPATAVALLQKAVEGLLEGYNPRENTESMRYFRDAHLRALRMLHELPTDIAGPAWTVKNVTRCVCEAREDIRYNFDAIDVLLRSGFINMQQLDECLAQSLENGMNYTAVVFAMQIVQIYLVDERANPIIYENDLQSTINSLVNINTMRRDAPPNLPQLLDLLRVVNDPTMLSDQPTAGPVHIIHVGKEMVRNRDYDDTLPEKTEYLLREWITAYVSGGRDQTKNFGLLFQQMGFHGVLKSDDMIGKFIRLSVELCVNNSHTTRVSERKQCYFPLDALIRLIYFLIKYTGDSNPSLRLNLLNKTLGIIVGVLLMEHETRASEFDPMPYQRLFIMLFLELTQSEPFLEALNFQIMTSFCHALFMVRPTKATKFSYAWLELIAHRAFLTRVMALTSQQKGWPLYAQLLKELFAFLAPFLRNTDLPKSIGVLYRGTLRVLLVLLHDFPEFLCDYHYKFCDVIPSNCIQMRNLILSAFPRNMRLPDPFTPNLKVDVLSEISVAPRMVANVGSMIKPLSFRKDLDSYLKLRAPVTFLSELRGHLQSKEPGMNYNCQLMNALVLYVGTQAINQIRAQGLSPTMSTIASSAHMDIFQNLGVDLDTEGRYLFLNAIANQLRYPNSHTHYFSCLLLSLFAESNTESIQEQITRVLLERLIVNRPHPWGLLITFIELIKNPIFKFWSHEFVHCAPEIEKLFESVARSCMVTKQSNQSTDNDPGEALTV